MATTKQRTPTNNPAGRLHALLTEAKKHPGQPKAREVWAKVFKLEPNNVPEVLRSIAELSHLPEEIAERIRSLKDLDQELHLGWLPKLTKVFSHLNLEAEWSWFSERIDATVLLGIEYCSDRLSRTHPEPELPESELSALRQQVHSLIESTINSELATDLKDYTLRHLRAVERALQEYAIHGAGPLMSAYEQSMGSLASTRHGLGERLAETSIGTDWFKLLAVLSMALSITTDASTLGGLPERATTIFARAVEAAAPKQIEAGRISTPNSGSEGTSERFTAEAVCTPEGDAGDPTEADSPADR